MDIDNLFKRVKELKERGYGKCQAVMFESILDEKPYHTTIEEIKVQKATFDKEQDVVVFIR